jgi:hypothetical protein
MAVINPSAVRVKTAVMAAVMADERGGALESPLIRM